MTLSQRTHAQIAAVALLVVCLGGADWYVNPELASRVLMSFVTMAGIWIVVFTSERAGTSSSQTTAQRRFIVLAAIFAGLVLAGALAVQLVDATGLASSEWTRRLQGIITSLMLVGIGNAMPKVLGPLTATYCSPGGAQAVQRFAGWTFVIVGAASTALWVFADVEQAQTLAMLLCAGAVITVIGRCVWTWSSARGSPPT